MSGQSQEASTSLISFAAFSSVALATTYFVRQQSSSEDLGRSGFDEVYEEDLERFVQAVPKIELHVHLDGAFDPHQVWAHLKKYPERLQCLPVQKHLPWTKADDPPLPIREMVESCQSVVDFRHLCTCRRRYKRLRKVNSGAIKKSTSKLRRMETPGTLEDMLTCFEFFFPVVYNDFEFLEELACDFVKRQHDQNVIYSEVRYSPHLLAEDHTKAHAAVTKGLRKGCEIYDVTVNQILCAINFKPEWSIDVVNLADRHRNNFPCAVVGVDIAAGEDHFSADSPFREAHYEMCQKAQHLGLNITLHAGETPLSERNVQNAIENYGAKRIGHGYHISGSQEVMEIVKSRGIHMEVCPTSSVETGGWKKTTWPDHPGCTFRDYGISQSLSSDDPAVFNTSLTWQYRVAMKKMGWNRDEILKMTEDAVQATFLPSDEEKAKLLQKVKDFSLVETIPNFNDRVHYE